MLSSHRLSWPGGVESMDRQLSLCLHTCRLPERRVSAMQDCAPQLCLTPGKVPAAWIAACRQGVVLSAQAMPEALPQVFVAAAVKMRVRPPKNAEELYEVDQGTSVVKGSRKMEHSNQLRWVTGPSLAGPKTT